MNGQFRYLVVVACLAVPAVLAVWGAGLLKLVGWRRYLVTAGVVGALTLVFDNLIVATGIVDYAFGNTLNIRIPVAPIEDLSYTLLGAALVPAIWIGLGGLGRLGGGDAKSFTLPQLIKQLFWASRPISWINTAFPYAAVFLVTGHRPDLMFWVGTFFFLIPYNLLMYGINDVYDYESDLRNPRKGSIEGAVLHPKWHLPTLTAAYLLPVAPVATMAWHEISSAHPATVFLLAILLFDVVAYSAKGMRFKEIPVLDSLSSSVHFVGPMVVAMAATGVPLDSAPSLLIIVAFLLWGMASHAFGAVQDIVADREAGLASIATVLGAKTTVRLAVAAYAAAGILTLFGPWPMPLAAIAAVPYLVIIWPFRNLADASAEEANRGWRRFIWLNYFAGFVVTMLLIYSALLEYYALNP